jgi:hypothetical protein
MFVRCLTEFRRNTLDRAGAAFGQKLATVVGCYYEDHDNELAIGYLPREEDLFAELIMHRKVLEKRSLHIEYMEKGYISSE